MTWESYVTAYAEQHGGYDPRLASPAMRGWLRTAFGLGRLLSRLGAAPTAVTAAGLVLNAAVPLVAALGRGWPAVAAALVLVAALADSVDGAVALISSRASRLGALYDAIVDRLGEVCWLLAFWALGAPAGLLGVCGVITLFQEYVWARAQAAGATRVVSLTVGGRAGRLRVAVTGLLLAGGAGLITQAAVVAGLVTIAAVVWASVGVFGLGQLLSGVRKSLR